MCVHVYMGVCVCGLSQLSPSRKTLLKTAKAIKAEISSICHGPGVLHRFVHMYVRICVCVPKLL